MSEKKQKLILAITVLFTIALSITALTMNPAESAEACCTTYSIDSYILQNYDANTPNFVDHYSKYNYYDSNSFGSSYSTYVWNYDWLNLFTPDLWFPNSWSN
jgi:hypothetical protein